MLLFSLILIILSSLAILYQDLKTRWIHIVSIFTLFLGSLFYRPSNLQSNLLRLVSNLIFITLVFSISFLYFYIKYGKIKSINKFIGTGDIFIIFTLSYFYSLYNFILFILLSSFLGLVFFFINLLLNKKIIRIPFAACMMFLHVISITAFEVNNYNPKNDISLTFLNMFL